MALSQFFFESRYLRGNTYVDVILPDLPERLDTEEFYRSGAKYPVLWLLHGTHGDASDWQRRTCIEHYACERNVIVVCRLPRTATTPTGKTTQLATICTISF